MRWNRIVLLCGLCVVVAASSGCALMTTTFYGDARVRNGASGCEQKCSQEGLEMAGMIMLGEYSDGCICAVPGRERQAVDAAGPAAGGAAAVVEQMRRQRRNQNQQTQ